MKTNAYAKLNCRQYTHPSKKKKKKVSKRVAFNDLETRRKKNVSSHAQSNAQKNSGTKITKNSKKEYYIKKKKEHQVV